MEKHFIEKIPDGKAWFLLTTCAPVSPLWLADFYALKNARNIIFLGPYSQSTRGGGYGFFSKKNILIPNIAEKNILILVEEKKDNLIQNFCHII
jgi:hypothetical protein